MYLNQTSVNAPLNWYPTLQREVCYDISSQYDKQSVYRFWVWCVGINQEVRRRVWLISERHIGVIESLY